MSFLKDYLVITKGNEAPALYHVFAGFSVLASLVGKRVWIEQGIFTFNPNLYVILVGSPGGGKSTALDIAKGFIRSMKTMPLSADAETVQSLLRKMSQELEGKPNPHHKMYKYDGKIIPYTPVTIFAGEFISFISMDPYGWITFLTTVYHEDVHEVSTKNKGVDLIQGPCVNLLGCLTPDTQINLLQQRVISSGFSRRTLYIWALGRGEPIPFPEVTQEQKDAMLRCIEYAKVLQTIEPGPMQWSPEARAWYGPWYTKLRNDLRDGLIGTATTTGYYESKHVQLLKLAMLFSLSESTDKVLQLDHFHTALAYLDQSEKELEKVFAGTGPNPHAGIAEKIMDVLERATRPMAEKEIYRSMYREATRNDIQSILHHLSVSERVHRWTNAQGVEYIAVPAVFTAYQKNKDNPNAGGAVG